MWGSQEKHSDLYWKASYHPNNIKLIEDSLNTIVQEDRTLLFVIIILEPLDIEM